MCERESTSDEHVPPKCIFPEQKDLPNNWDLRKQLIKVPSCDKHNLEKSKDDEYLLYSLVINLMTNDIAQNQFATKIIRSIKRNPSLFKRYFKDQLPISLENNSGIKFPTVAVQVENDRINSAFDKIGRALYYNYYKKKWNSQIRVFTEYLIFLGTNDSINQNKDLIKFSHKSDELFKNQPYFGENSEVFKFQILETPKLNNVMRLYFYEYSKITLHFIK